MDYMSLWSVSYALQRELEIVRHHFNIGDYYMGDKQSRVHVYRQQVLYKGFGWRRIQGEVGQGWHVGPSVNDPWFSYARA